MRFLVAIASLGLWLSLSLGCGQGGGEVIDLADAEIVTWETVTWSRVGEPSQIETELERLFRQQRELVKRLPIDVPPPRRFEAEGGRVRYVWANPKQPPEMWWFIETRGGEYVVDNLAPIGGT